MQEGQKAVWNIQYVSVEFFPSLNIVQSSHEMYSNNILNFQESTRMLNAHTKKSGNLSYAPPMS